MDYIPEPRLDPCEPEPVYLCEDSRGCRNGIYDGEPYYEIDGFLLCEACGKRYLDALYQKRASEQSLLPEEEGGAMGRAGWEVPLRGRSRLLRPPSGRRTSSAPHAR